MSGVEVLAVMDADARAVACVIDECLSPAREASWRAHLAEHDKARAAVAELIEADKEYDAAYHSEADTDGMLRREEARVRRAAALARATGAAP